MGDALTALGINGPFLISQAVNFLILFGVLTLLLWKPAMRRLDARREMLRQQQEDAAEVARMRTEANQEKTRMLDEAKVEATRILTEARAQAQEIVKRANAEARAEAERYVAQARRDAEAERNMILGQMRDQIGALAIAAAHQLVGEALDEQRQRALVNAFFSGIREGRVTVLPEGVERAEGPVQVTSALPLTEGEQATIRRELTARLGDKIEVSFHVEPQLLGGLVLRVGDRVIDGSMAGHLEQLRQSLA